MLEGYKWVHCMSKLSQMLQLILLCCKRSKQATKPKGTLLNDEEHPTSFSFWKDSVQTLVSAANSQQCGKMPNRDNQTFLQTKARSQCHPLCRGSAKRQFAFLNLNQEHSHRELPQPFTPAPQLCSPCPSAAHPTAGSPSQQVPTLVLLPVPAGYNPLFLCPCLPIVSLPFCSHTAPDQPQPACSKYLLRVTWPAHRVLWLKLAEFSLAYSCQSHFHAFTSATHLAFSPPSKSSS